MSENDVETKTFGAIANHLTNEGLRKAVSTAVEGLPSINLHQELETISHCIERANKLISKQKDADLAGIRNTQTILNQHGLNQIPNPLEPANNPRPWLRSIFRWYLYDGVGRMVAIHLGISNSDKGQERDGDWIACAITEAAVNLAEKGDPNAQEVVKNMLDMGFIAKGWLLTDQLVERAEILKSRGIKSS